MRKSILLLIAAAAPLAAQQQQSALPANFAVSSAKNLWSLTHGFVVSALEITPDSLLAFRPTPDVRSLGQLAAHVADAEHLFCALALGEPMPNPMDAVEKSKTTKAELLQALKESAAHCERAYAQTDAEASGAVNFMGRQANRLFLLNLNGSHDHEHYGNIATYLRLNGIVPPTSRRAQ